MNQGKTFFRWLTVWLLLSVLGVALVGRAGQSVRAAPAAQTPLSILINEVAWAGTVASSDDDWIELFNPSPATSVDISSWDLVTNTFSITFPAGSIIPGGGYYLLERRELATSVASNLIYSGLLFGNSGDTLRLRRADGTLVDSANLDGGAWPAGNPTTTATMQRSAAILDSRFGLGDLCRYWHRR